MRNAHSTVPATLQARAASTPDRPFIQMVGGTPITYGETYERARAIAGGLARLGVEPGDRVAILAPNSVDAVLAWLGINLAGAIEVALNTAYRGRSLEHVLSNSRAKVALVEDELVPGVAEVEDAAPALTEVVVHGAATDASAVGLRRARSTPFGELLDAAPLKSPPVVAPSDIASVIYTSGTTGMAKGVLMPHRQVTLLAQTSVDGLRLSGEDVYYCFHPLFHMAGKFMAILATMTAGGRVVFDVGFEPAAWLDRIRGYGATVSLAHGPMIEMIHAQPERNEDAEQALSRVLAAPLPARIARSFEQRFGIVGVEVWGMTEVNVPVWRPYDEPLRVGSCGRVRQDLYEVKIADPDTDELLPAGHVGEIVVRPREPWTIMQGYLDSPEETVGAWRNLWFHTGDLGRFDADGYLFFVDRVKERIRRRGENVSSYEIEFSALEHPAVAECAAVGVPSGFESDDDIKLCVVPAEPQAVDCIALLKHLARSLPHYMVPRYIEVLDELPRTPTNKVQKAVLRDVGITERTWDRKAAGVALRDLVDSLQTGRKVTATIESAK